MEIKAQHSLIARSFHVLGVFKIDEDGKLEEATNDRKEEAEAENGDEKVSEVTLSVTASMASQVMTFTDVDKTLHAGEQKGTWNGASNGNKG